LYLLLKTPFSICGPHIVRRAFTQIRAIGSLSFWSTPTFQCRRAGLSGSGSCEWWILSGVKGGSTADVCAVRRRTYLILRCIPRVTSLVGVNRDSRYTIFLTTSKCLSPIATLCPTSRIVLSYWSHYFSTIQIKTNISHLWKLKFSYHTCSKIPTKMIKLLKIYQFMSQISRTLSL
jgi:hypothetical protein